MSANLEPICQEIIRADQDTPPNYELCDEITLYLNVKNTVIFCNKYGKDMSNNIIRHIDLNCRNIICSMPIENINEFKFIYLKSKHTILLDHELEYVFNLMKTSQVYTMDMMNTILEISIDLDDNLYSNGIKNILLELAALCCQNISNFNIKNIKPRDLRYLDGLTPMVNKVIETIIALSRILISQDDIDYLARYNINVQEPERFFN